MTAATGAAAAESVGTAGLAGLLLGAAGMFAVMYSTQAILPELSRDFSVSPSQAGLTVSVVVLALAIGAWAWGPLSDRWGRKRSLVLASALIVLPTVGAGLAPTFASLLAFRALQGLCMPGLLTVGIPYVTEAFAPQVGRAMGYYLCSLVVGGMTGRIGVALLTQAVGWRWAIGGLAVLPFLGSVVLHRHLVDLPAPKRAGGIAHQLRNPRVLRAALVGSAFFFTFVGTFSFVVYRLEASPFSYGTAAGSVVFVLWVLGGTTPLVGRLVDRVGWPRIALAAVGLCAGGLLLSLPDHVSTLAIGLGCFALGNFSGVTAAQIGVATATETDRGAATAVYFSLYYTCGALGAYLPGLAWQAWGWTGVVALAVAVLCVAVAALALIRPSRLGAGQLQG